MSTPEYQLCLKVVNAFSKIYFKIMLFKRREFLQIGSLATASLMLPKFLKAFEESNGSSRK